MENNKRKRVAIYGGSYNPPTIGHFLIAMEIYNKINDIDEIWLEPCGDNRPDKSVIVPAKLRFKMCELLLEDLVPKDIPIKVDDYELVNNKYYPTYYLLSELREKYKDCEFIFVLGLDILEDVQNWEESEKLLNEFEFIIMPRNNESVEDEKYKKYLPKKYQTLYCNFDISSTNIRERIKTNKRLNFGINGLTSRKVIEFIKENKLYQQ